MGGGAGGGGYNEEVRPASHLQSWAELRQAGRHSKQDAGFISF